MYVLFGGCVFSLLQCIKQPWAIYAATDRPKKKGSKHRETSVLKDETSISQCTFMPGDLFILLHQGGQGYGTYSLNYVSGSGMFWVSGVVLFSEPFQDPGVVPRI